MKSAAFMLTWMLCGPSEPALAQARGDRIAQQDACSQADRPGRFDCTDQVSRSGQNREAGAAATGHWVLSETTSPVNYGPLVIATTSSRSDSDGMASLLSISCRNGRTELVITNTDSSSGSRRTDDVLVTYQVYNQPVVQERWRASTTGNRAVFAGDVVRFIRSLPDQGEISIRALDSRGIPHDARFLLDGLSIVRQKVAEACNWPGASAVPRQ
jgi:hypothetical protein